MRWLSWLASLRLTLLILIALAAGVLTAYASEQRTTWALAVPLALLAVNLGAALATNPVFRRQTALLSFHLALIAIVLLVAAGRLTYLKGQVELSQGEWFDGALKQRESGPWHAGALERIRFVNDGFSIDYDVGVRRGATANRVRWLTTDGSQASAVIGDQRPLALEGYRFYTTFNKGFAPLFIWHPAGGGAPQRGTVHLPAWPLHEHRQALEWTPPGSGVTLWTMLQIDEVLLDPEHSFRFRVPERHRVIIRIDDERREMLPGDRYVLPQGTLAYEGLTAWMGYAVFYDWTIPWLLAAAAVAVASLSLHFWRKFAARPWDAHEETGT